MEIGIACATFGLILASLMGGPIARFLINRHNLTPDTDDKPNVGLSAEDRETGIGSMDFPRRHPRHSYQRYSSGYS